MMTSKVTKMSEFVTKREILRQVEPFTKVRVVNTKVFVTDFKYLGSNYLKMLGVWWRCGQIENDTQSTFTSKMII